MTAGDKAFPDAVEPDLNSARAEDLLRTGALQAAIFNSANFSSIATDASGVIQIFNVMTTDPRGIITDVNRQMEALTGCTRDELIRAPFKDCCTDPERAEAGINRVLNEGQVLGPCATRNSWPPSRINSPAYDSTPSHRP